MIYLFNKKNMIKIVKKHCVQYLIFTAFNCCFSVEPAIVKKVTRLPNYHDAHPRCFFLSRLCDNLRNRCEIQPMFFGSYTLWRKFILSP